MPIDYVNDERCPGGAPGRGTDKTNASPPAGREPLAKGLNPDVGGAVFAVGSIPYASAPLGDSRTMRSLAFWIGRG